MQSLSEYANAIAISSGVTAAATALLALGAWVLKEQLRSELTEEMTQQQEATRAEMEATRAEIRGILGLGTLTVVTVTAVAVAALCAAIYSATVLKS